MTENEIKVIDRRLQPDPLPPAPMTPFEVIQSAINKGFDPSLIEKMMDLQERHERNEARKAYHDAMASFKSDPPEIEKDREVSFGQGKTSYKHASLANVTHKINKALSLHGLSASWTLEQDEAIKVTCTITHRMGHSESTSLSAEPDTSGSKNSIQAIGSTISYLERYTILALCGLATKDMDDDGNDSGQPEFISEGQSKAIKDIMRENEFEVADFLKYMNAPSVDEILLSDYQKAMAALRKKIAATKRKPDDNS